MEIELSRGYKAVIDDEDFELVKPFRWTTKVSSCVKGSFYAVCKTVIDGRRVTLYMHRLIAKAKTGELVDHIDHDPLNNRRSNLRTCSHAQNMRNRKAHAGSSTGIKNVFLRKDRNGRTGVVAAVYVDGKTNSRRFKSIEEASAWAADMRAKLHGEFAYQAEQDKSQHEILRGS